MRFPDEASLRWLGDLHVTYVVVHLDLYPPEERENVERRLQQWGEWLSLEHSEDGGRVYSLHEPAER
jgi:hypothetical protein